MSAVSLPQTEPYLAAFKGGFINLLRWPQLDQLWQTLQSQTDKNWYVYAVGEQPPEQPCNQEQLVHFIQEIDQLLHAEHQEDYCGIVYVDNRDDPTFIKIYDPNNLGAVCGSTGAPPPLPGWILSLMPPINLQDALPPPGNRRRWWQRIFS